MDFDINQDGIRELYEQIGNQVRDIVNTTARVTWDDDLDAAVRTLLDRPDAVGGLNFKHEWVKNTIETLRRGDDLEMLLQ